jgi:hypothetical protein
MKRLNGLAVTVVHVQNRLKITVGEFGKALGEFGKLRRHAAVTIASQ